MDSPEPPIAQRRAFAVPATSAQGFSLFYPFEASFPTKSKEKTSKTQLAVFTRELHAWGEKTHKTILSSQSIPVRNPARRQGGRERRQELKAEKQFPQRQRRPAACISHRSPVSCPHRAALPVGKPDPSGRQGNLSENL